MRRPLAAMIGAVVSAAVIASAVFTVSPGASAADPARADVVVYGGSAAGVISAVAAAREGKKVVLLSENDHVGGLVSGGLGGTDIGNSATIGGYSREFFDRARKHYVDKYGADSEQARTAGAQGYQFEPHVAENIFKEMLAEAKVSVMYGRRIKSVSKAGSAVESLTVATADGKEETYSAPVFIDASYEGDVMAKAGVKYHVGREGREVYGESIAGVQANSPAHQFSVKVNGLGDDGKPLPLVQAGDPGKPGQGDRKVQSYNFRLCLTNKADNRVAFPKPDGYDPKRYELVARLLKAQPNKAPASFFNTRRMPNAKTDSNNNGPVSTDHIGANWDYPDGDPETRKRIWKDHEDYLKGLLYFLANDPQVPEATRAYFNEWGLAKDEFTDTGHWPHQLYVREARRMLGEYVMTEKDILAHGDATNLAKTDSVCLGSYNTDSHHVQRVLRPDGTVYNEGDFQIRVTPYAISYRSLVPKAAECSNLLVPVCCSASHIAYCTIRMEPVYMMLGQASGVAAAMAVDAKQPVQAVDVAKLQEKLKAQKAILDPMPFQKPAAATGSAKPATLDVSKLGGVVVDDKDAAKTGEWAASDSTPGFVGQGYLHDDNKDKGKKTVRFTPKLPAAGKYEVRIAYTPNPNRASNVPVVVHSKEGDKALTVNQKHVLPERKPLSLGTFEFAEGSDGWVEIRTDGTDGHVIADAVVFVPVK
jgi:hypothetical protein